MKNLVSDRKELLNCLQMAGAGVEIILQSGLIFKGALIRVDETKIRIKTRGKTEETQGCYVDSWFRFLSAVKFSVKENFADLAFEPYQVKQPQYAKFQMLDQEEQKHYRDAYELLGFFLEGRRQGSVPRVKVCLVGGNKFEGAIEIVSATRCLLGLDKLGNGNNVYLDFHPSMLAAFEFELGSAGYPYDPTAC